VSGDLYSLALTIPWCITADAMEAVLSMAARDPLPDDEIARRMHGPKSLALRNGKRREDSGRMTMHGPVAVIPIDGPIYRYADIFTRASGGVTTDSLARDLQHALDDPKVSGVLFAIDSPGGEVTGINELADMIYVARGRKPIVSYVEGYGASAAYWIASAADLVVADSTALLGSIGTIMGVPDPTKRPSYRIDFVSKQSPKKKPDVTTDVGRAVIQQLVDELTDVFIAQVARNRSLATSDILTIEGGLLVGQHAVDAGLADMLGSEEGAVSALAQGTLPARGPSLLRPAYSTPRMLAATAGLLQERHPMADDKQGFWAGLLNGAREAGLVVPQASADPPAAPAPAATTTTDPGDQRLASENAELKRQLARVQAERVQVDAQAFVARHADQCYPTETQALAALYARAAETDAASPRSDGQPSCVALLEAATAARPAHQLSTDLISPQSPAAVLTNTSGSEAAEAEARAERVRNKQQNGRRGNR
jgi:signal peptide peptidase SppA